MRISLNGMWKATEDLGLQARAGKTGFDAIAWSDVAVPGHWQQAPGLERHTGPLLYRRSFSWDGSLEANHPARLHFDGIFTTAKVWFNGAFMGEHTGYFIAASYDVTRYLRPGENVVMVEVASPPEPDGKHRHQITGLFGHWDAKPPGREPGGIWRDVAIEIYPGVFPERFQLHTLLDRLPPVPLVPDELRKVEEPAVEGPVTATVGFELDFTAARESRLTWTATIAPETFSGQEFSLSGGQPVRRGWNRLKSSLSIMEPQLWWTWDHGRPDLYRLTLNYSVDGAPVQRVERLFGIRKVELRAWHLYLNGRRIFIRGTQVGPPDFHMAQVGPEAYRRDMELVRAAHMNLVRVRAHVDRPELYEEASRQGILLWQDFPLQGLYSRSILDEARRQARTMVELLGHWPAVGLWCGHADPVRPVDQNTPALLDRSLAALSWLTGSFNMSGLATAVRDAIRTADSTRPCLTHPAEWGNAENRLYLGWQSGRLQDLGRTLKLFPDKARFVGEFGAQSFPVVEHSRRFTRGQWPNLNWSDLKESYMLQPRIMDRHVPPSQSASFEQYVEATQAYQARVCRHYIERLRRVKYSPCGGIMTYLFADVAPGVTWSLVDYWREPKAAYRAVQAAFQPIHILAEWPQSGYLPGAKVALPVFLVNDLYQNSSGRWSWAVERQGLRLAGAQESVYLPPDRVLTLPDGIEWTVPEDVPAGELALVLTLQLEGRDEITNRYLFSILAPPVP